MLVILLVILRIGYRGLYLTTFDAGYASTLGVSVALWHYVLMGMVSLATVVSFESVGAIMVIAFLVGPAATSALFAKRLPWMIGLAASIGVLSSILGYFLAVVLNASVSGSIAVMIGVIFAFALLLKRFFPS
jgi:manganese/zinc/iron transport system permease protein